jgi:CheY-like chemotaxis protein
MNDNAQYVQAEQRRHILLVEDTLDVAQALSRALGLPRGGNHQVEVCETGECALKQLQNRCFDLLISDFRLPGINGLELLKHARQLTPQTRRILITALESSQVEEEARQLADAYFAKPFSLREMIYTVQQIFSVPPLQTQPLSQERVPEPKRFYFCDEFGHYLDHAAANLEEFHEALTILPLNSLRYHLQRGDFSRWFQDVLYDNQLASRVSTLNHHSQGESLRRALIAMVNRRYKELTMT